MPRANRYLQPGVSFHLTHRCHNRAFLFRFGRDRSLYRELLRQQLAARKVALLSYTITCNHIHLVVRTDDDDTNQVSELMQRVQGQFAQDYNRRRKRHGAFWEDRFHATMVEDGTHLWNCLVYLDLNMVRAGVVKHPEEWKWTGFQELMGARQRYRLVNLDKLLRSVEATSVNEFRLHYRHTVERRLAEGLLAREPHWTTSIAVGSRPFVERVAAGVRYRQHLEYQPLPEDQICYTLHEGQSSYAAIVGGKNET